MTRGTTSQFKFSLPYEFNQLETVKVVFWQPGNKGTTEQPLPIYKLKDSCIEGINPKELSVTLVPWETIAFSDESKAYVQLSATTKEGSRFASKQKVITVYPIYDAFDDGFAPPSDNDGFSILDGGVIGET